MQVVKRNTRGRDHVCLKSGHKQRVSCFCSIVPTSSELYVVNYDPSTFSVQVKRVSEVVSLGKDGEKCQRIVFYKEI